MTANVGNLDRIARAVLGLGLIVLALAADLPLFATPSLKYGAVIVGAVLLATAGMRFCPLYRLLGMNTCKV